ncbi:MAG: SRPBCC family protein [Bacteroidota bacterium]
MKYTCEIDLALPISKVIELFDNPDNMSKWQPGLISFEHLSGEPGQPGAKSKLLYDMNGREMEMIETIDERNLPSHFSGTYTTKGVTNHMRNEFISTGSTKTKWKSHNIFKFSGFMAIMSLFMKGAFSKQTQKYMVQFKAFAEGES